MMSNSWRDPVWRARVPAAGARGVDQRRLRHARRRPTARPRRTHNPFALPGQCASSFDIGTGKVTVSRPGSLLDAFCSRCHMPTNYVDNVPLRNVKIDAASRHRDRASSIRSSTRRPTTAPASRSRRSSRSSATPSRARPASSAPSATASPPPATRRFTTTRRRRTRTRRRSGGQARDQVVQPAGARHADRRRSVASATSATRSAPAPTGCRRTPSRSPSASGRCWPGTCRAGDDDNTSTVFGQPVAYQQLDASKHKGIHSALYVRAEMCAACHDVTNALPIKNPLGRWVGGFPIERTYTEWLNSRYADRPGNTNFDPAVQARLPVVPHAAGLRPARARRRRCTRTASRCRSRSEPVATDGKPRPFFTHHFVGGNAFVPRLIGKDVDASRQRRALPGAVDVQLLVGRPQEPVLARLLDAHRAQGRLRAAGAAGLGSPAPRARA